MCNLRDLFTSGNVLISDRQKNYAEAEKIKRLADTLEARETQKIGQDRKQQIKKLEVCVSVVIVSTEKIRFVWI